MGGIDINALFARAERAFAAGQLETARADLVQVQRLAGDHPAILHLLGLVEKKRGVIDAAKASLERAHRLAPADPQINNNLANLLGDIGRLDDAVAHYERALAAQPHFTEARYNRALVLQKLGRLDEALADLDHLLASRREARFLAARGSVLRALDRRAEAAAAYDAALAVEPARLSALHGRARVALERGEEDAVTFYRRARALRPEDDEILLGLAQALEAEGDPEGIALLAAAVRANPTWSIGHSTLARMRWEAGEGRDFTRDMEQALASNPHNRALWTTLAGTLAAADLPAEAADAALKARSILAADDELSLLEAFQASEAGQIERATQLFDRLPDTLPGRSALEARHRLRIGDYEGAARFADQAREENPADIGAWAVTGLVWRLVGDSRADWLNASELVTATPLALDAAQVDAIADRLRSLHRTRSHPIGQSVRGGTQTRGSLFAREEPEILMLKKAVTESVGQYWERLAPRDPLHPLRRHCGQTPRFAGSWSVRLIGGGFHVSHFHPNGLLSSACYLVVPAEAQPLEGWLEVGGPPANLDLTLEPLSRIRPVPGHLALFPSYLYHGTRPFAAGERLTAAFDIAL
ncbi:tetratricopeptide repeat protein [Sphingomonas sp. LY54]|uniref:tetratricopeptide repeat protein n=1 Tax=Sphingomonas sp. LY54 TaxID=3095343 RepID=UPI002D767159|nr:tetratricopeptide repeat protein [Sphingomonas sp. LY54]WRP27659.1 tetratricopeptide repeat protein [Sphingomonas sp. LY54]